MLTKPPVLSLSKHRLFPRHEGCAAKTVRPFDKLRVGGFGLCALLLFPTPTLARDVTTSPAIDTSVTIYRAPNRNGGDMSLSSLGGFAVVTETRRVDLPAGESRVRFEGVTEGIIPESALVSGLPGGVAEKNRDNALLSPSALYAASVAGRVQLKRTDPKTGKARLIPATVSSANEDGVVLKTDEGYEALRCSGMAEGIQFEPSASGPSAVPTLSVITRSPRATSAMVTLTYITEKFDWSASYTARINPDGKSMHLGGWITLANGNSVSLNNARAQIIAGGVYRAYVAKFINAQPRVVANCYPLGKTSDIPLKPDAPYELVSPYRGAGYQVYTDEIMVTARKRTEAMDIPMPVAAMSAVAVSAPPPPEQLGDLKLYRVPQRTTVAAMQMKQTRLVEQAGVKFERFYRNTNQAAQWYGGDAPRNAAIVIRTRNDKANGLGLPLPAGSITFEQAHGDRVMLVGQPALSDKAENEKIELELGDAPSITVTRRIITRGPGHVEPADLSRDQNGWLRPERYIHEFEVANSEPQPVPFELKLQIQGTQKITRASHKHAEVDGAQVFKLTVPANDRVVVRYVVEG